VGESKGKGERRKKKEKSEPGLNLSKEINTDTLFKKCAIIQNISVEKRSLKYSNEFLIIAHSC
jgi:hypothetical protein